MPMQADGSGSRQNEVGRTNSTVHLYTPSEAAQLLRLRESWLRRKASLRQIPCTFLGKHLRFTNEDLEEIVRQGNRKVRPN